ncbi:MAG: sialidase family protein, partial [candidate division WOR-3 bacterium]
MWYKMIALIFMVAGILSAFPTYSPDGWRMPISVVTEPTYNQHYSDVDAIYDSVFMVWIDGRQTPNYVGFKYSTDVGFTWSAEQTIPNPSGTGDAYDHLSIVLDKRVNSGWTYILWSSYNPATARYSLNFSRSSNRGQTWVSSVLWTDLIVEPAGSICVGPDGVIRIAWFYGRRHPDFSSVLYQYSVDNGA